MRKMIISIFLFIGVCSYGQNDSPRSVSDTAVQHSLNKERLYIITGIHATGYAGTLLILSQAWYDEQERTGFHTFNDAKEWLQMDKVGHGWTAYNIAKYSTGLWEWTGMSHKKAVIYGGLSSMGYQTILEFLDAYSAKWGWSWADVGANVFGTGLYTSQELLWKEQKLQFKFSAHRERYPGELQTRANELYGKSLPERLLKDYNKQTYWLSLNLNSVTRNRNLPAWLNISVGYGAEGLFGGFENKGYDSEGNVIFDRPDIKRYRQWYLSPDIDFTKIKTNKQVVRSLLSFLNMIKVPAPALEYSNGKLKGHWLHF